MFEVCDLCKNFDDLNVLNNINVKIDDGEKVVILGPSGAGKSSFLRCLNGLETPSSGHVNFNGIDLNVSDKNLRLVRKKVGMVFQKFNLFPHLTVFQNITLAPRITYPKETKKYENIAMNLLGRIGLLNKKNSYPGELSGGQQQRIAIVRALVINPEVLLFDEPTSALDPEMILEVLTLIKDIANTGLTMIIVTHELSFAKKIATRVLFMDNGKILEDSSTENFFKEPKTKRAKEFLTKVEYEL